MRAWILVLFAGCRIGFESRAGAGADSMAADSGDGACTGFGPWGTPSPIATVNSPGHDCSPALTPDGLALVFQSDRQGDEDLFVATRLGLTLYFLRDMGGVSPRLFRSTRAATTDTAARSVRRSSHPCSRTRSTHPASTISIRRSARTDARSCSPASRVAHDLFLVERDCR